MKTAIDVKLNVFEGPLDLLLHLIEKNKVDIYDIPISEITEQYLQYLRTMQEENLDIMSDFLVMAATLLKIKARMLLPMEAKEEKEEDPREELVHRLIEYKIYKYASVRLKAWEKDAQKSFYKQEEIPMEVLKYREDVDPSQLIGDLTLQRLGEIFQFVMRKREDKKDPVRSTFGQIKEEEVKLEDKIIEIENYMMEKKKASFFVILTLQKTKEAVVVTFLSILELMKTGKIKAFQNKIGGDIIIEALEQKT